MRIPNKTTIKQNRLERSHTDPSPIWSPSEDVSQELEMDRHHRTESGSQIMGRDPLWKDRTCKSEEYYDPQKTELAGEARHQRHECNRQIDRSRKVTCPHGPKPSHYSRNQS